MLRSVAKISLLLLRFSRPGVAVLPVALSRAPSSMRMLLPKVSLSVPICVEDKLMAAPTQLPATLRVLASPPKV